MRITSHESRVTSHAAICGVLLLASLTASWTMSQKALSNHECFVSITASEMLQSGDWTWPTCNGQPRLQKTPLSYWLVAGLAGITGKVDEFTARMPSAVFAVLSVVTILYFVNHLLSFRIAAISAAVWTTSMSYIRYAHNARPEMALTFFIAMCLLSFYSAVNARSRKRQVVYMLLFWISFGLANLAKGPAPMPLVLIPLFFYVAIFRQWKKLPKLLPVIGVIIFLAIVLPWPLAIAHRVSWDLTIWKKEFIDRFFGSYASGDKPFYYFLPRMFLFTLPWAAFLPMALAAPFYRIWDKKQHLMQFLWLWFVADLLFLTINGGKRQHYILPLMPAMAVLTGILIEDMVFVRKAYTQRFAANVLRSHIVVMIAVAVAGPVLVLIAAAKGPIHAAKTNSELFATATIFGIVTLIIATVVAVLFAKGKPVFACVTVFAGIAVFVMISYVSFINPFDYNRYSRSFSKKVAEIVPPSSKLVAYEYVSMSTVHYFGRVIPKIRDKSVLYGHYTDGDWVIATADHLRKLERDGLFTRVYYRENAERRGQEDAGGALFHKSSPVLKDDL